MPNILGEIGFDAADLPDHSTLVKSFERIKTAVWRVLLRLSAQLHEASGHAAIDATFFDREHASTVLSPDELPCADAESDRARGYGNAGDSRRALPTSTRHDTQLGWQVARRNAGDLHSLAADKGYDWMELRGIYATTA